MSKHPKKNALQVQKENQASVDKARAQGQHGGFTRSESSTGLTTAKQRVEDTLLRKAGPGFDTMEPGGFAKRDQLRQAVNEDIQQLKRQKRVYNSAYRKAMRDGNSAQAIDILNDAKKNKINFGGIQAAGRDREQVLQRKGEDLITAIARDGKASGEAPKASSEVPEGFLGATGKPQEQSFSDKANQLAVPFSSQAQVDDTGGNSGPEESPVDDAKGGVGIFGGGLNRLIGGVKDSFESLKDRFGPSEPDSPTDRQGGGFFDPDPEDPNSQSASPKEASDAFDSLFKPKKATEGLSGQSGGFHDPLPDSQTGKFKQKVERFQPFTSEAMSAQKSGRISRSDGQNQSKQQAFFRNATKALGKGLSEPGFGVVQEHVRKAVIRGEINPRYGSQYLADIAGVFKDYERLKSFGLLGSVSKPPSRKDIASSPEALFNWVSDVKDQAINKKK